MFHRTMCVLGGLVCAVVVAYASPACALGWSSPVGDCTIATAYGVSYGSQTHRGVDLAGSAGEAVSAPTAGTVVFAGSVPADGGGTCNAITIELPSGDRVSLSPLSEVWVEEGAAVSAAEQVGALAPCGDDSSGATHLHLSLRQDGAYVDPTGLLPSAQTAPAPAPVAPTVPKEPVDPVEPGQPGQPVEPAQPAESAESAQPARSAQSASVTSARSGEVAALAAGDGVASPAAGAASAVNGSTAVAAATAAGAGVSVQRQPVCASASADGGELFAQAGSRQVLRESGAPTLSSPTAPQVSASESSVRWARPSSPALSRLSGSGVAILLAACGLAALAASAVRWKHAVAGV